MLDIKFIRENPEAVKENIKKKFQEQKLPLVDEVIALDSENRAVMAEAQELRSARNTLSKQVGMLMGQAKKDPSKLAEAEAAKAKVKANADRLSELEAKEDELAQKVRKIMLQIPNIIDPSVPRENNSRYQIADLHTFSLRLSPSGGLLHSKEYLRFPAGGGLHSSQFFRVS